MHARGILFDLIKTQRFFYAKKSEGISQVVLTNRIFATLGEDNHPHIRPSIYSFPSVISLPGIVEGPAKPKEFYIYKQRYAALGAWELKEDEVKKRFKGQFIDYNDKRLTEVTKGYIAQALFFYMTGEPFCDKKSCRLYNAHWQKDLIYSQISSGKFCATHQSLLEKIRAQNLKKPKQKK